jgi:thioredoxin-dependent peroxiredoxin
MKIIIASAFFLGTFLQACQSQEKHLGVGDPVPRFSLYDQDNRLFNIEDHIGKQVMVVYFYPKDESSVCTKEACTFRDDYAEFTRNGVLVAGINSGSVASHKSFQKNHNLPFFLLSDPDNKVLKQFGVKGKFIFTGRETFVIDLSGKIVYTYSAFTQGSKHAEEALQFIKSAKN